jgi:PAS domain S-box-containing protein
VTQERQAVYSNGMPLLVLAALFLGVSGAIAPSFWRRRARRREAEVRASLRERELQSIEAISAALSQAGDVESVARVLLDEIASLFSVEFVGLALVDEERNEANGLLARRDGKDFAFWRELRLDLRREPSGIASAVFDVAPVTVYDTDTSPLINQAVAGAIGAKSAAFVPLVSGERVIAVLAIATTRERRSFSTEELGPLRTLAAEAALALERARSATALEEALDRQRALLNAAQVVTGELQVQPVLQVLVDQVTQLLEADAADCYLFTPDGTALRCAAVHGLDQAVVGFEFPADHGLAGRAIAEAAPVREADYQQIDEPVPHPAYGGFAGAIVAPMTWSGETRGVLGVGSLDSTRVFTEADLDALATFATLASLALRNAESFEERERLARVESGFSRIASLLGEPVSLAATLDAVAQAAAEAFGGDLAAVLTSGAEGYRLAGVYEVPDDLRAVFAEGLPEGAEVLDRAAQDGRTIASATLDVDDRFGDDFREVAQASSLLAIPILAPRSDRHGLALVLFRKPRAFTDDDLELAGQLVTRAKAALERSELFDVERRSRLLAQQLAHTGSLFSGELEPAAVLDEVVEQAPVLLRADASSIRLLEGDELVTAAAVGSGAQEAQGSRVPADVRPAGAVVHSGAPVAIEDVGGEQGLLEGEPMLGDRYASYLAVPLFGADENLQGVLAVYARRPRAWQEEEIEALGALAASASVAFSKAELYQQVELERERSVAILVNVADGIVAVERDERIVLWNAAAERITGVPSEEALGRAVPEVLQRELRSETGAAAGDRLVPIRRGDQEVWLSLTEAVMRDPLGETAGRIFAFRDISAERVVEQMRSDFVSTVSHELRAPLTSIYGFAATLLREDVQFEEHERRTFLTYIESEAERLTTIVDKLLSVARLDAGDLQLEIAPVDVRLLVSEVVDSAREEVVNGNEIVAELPEVPLAARTDRDKLRLVLASLVENAIRFSPGGGRVTVGAERRGETIVVSVVDQGIGIADAEHERIFSKFYRVGDAQTGGTGVGLFIAQGLVSALGGRITVRSAEGHGSSFVVELPARDADGRNG